MRELTPKDLCYETLGDQFRSAVFDYDTHRRVEILVDEFLPPERLAGKRALDVGCGLGFFSARLKERGALVTACDVGPSLVERTRAMVGCDAMVADALQLVDVFGPESFDVIVSSECIEHTPSPSTALSQMAAVLKTGGYLSVSTPNVVWWPAVYLATRLGIRPYEGYENFSSWGRLRRTLRANGLTVLREYGLHLIPFQLRLNRVSLWLDTRLQFLKPFMINMCMLARKGSR
ncbi:MAG: methyltransferase domain-containing protein [Thermodesulfobacteriota bacterium]